jgi:eukaryotic-like serine/threonine-protein kinase
MAAGAANSDVLAWVTDRNGPYEIWVRSSAGSERPAVAAAQFPDDKNRWFMDPSPSPDGQKLIFVRIEHGGIDRLWILSLAGGSPVRLTNVEPGSEMGGSWSPDGSRFAYVQVAAGKRSLMVVRTSGDAAPLTLRANVGHPVPVWSPSGDWIAFGDDKGWNLISPDGKSSRLLGDLPTQSVVFSRDGRLIYGIMAGDHSKDLSAYSGDRAILFSRDLTTLRQTIIKDLGPDFVAKTNFAPGIRFTLTPDGKSLTYVTGKSHSDLWMLQGFRQPGWLDRF